MDESVNYGDGGDDGEVRIGFMLLLLLSTVFMEVVWLLSDGIKAASDELVKKKRKCSMLLHRMQRTTFHTREMSLF